MRARSRLYSFAAIAAAVVAAAVLLATVINLHSILSGHVYIHVLCGLDGRFFECALFYSINSS